MDNSLFEMFSRLFSGGFSNGQPQNTPSQNNPAFNNYPSDLMTDNKYNNQNSNFYNQPTSQNFNANNQNTFQNYSPNNQNAFQNFNDQASTQQNSNFPFNQNLLSMLFSMMGGKAPNLAEMMSMPKDKDTTKKSSTPPSDEILL